ncbi:galaxin-like [Sycon ciliatum]|uniref:galaxin-like n=1 Tax=Sycon ciliatum TaxID=27933 RepID=UPI0031F6A154
MALLACLVVVSVAVSLVDGQPLVAAKPWIDILPPGPGGKVAAETFARPYLKPRPNSPPTPQPSPGFPQPWVSRPTPIAPDTPPAPMQTQKPKMGECAGQAFTTAEWMCCEGNIVRGTIETGFQCCGPEAYNNRTEVCCMGTIETAPMGSKCCAGTVYHPSREMCCMDMVAPGPERTKTCCGTESYANATQGCCGGTAVFEHAIAMCCDGAITTDGPAAVRECCGTNTFPKGAGHMCCAGNVVNANPAQEKCCGADIYNPYTDICCQDTVMARSQPGAVEHCCGAGIIGPLSACCGNNTVYDPAMQQCCGGQVADGTPPQFMCCGPSSFSIFGESLCCNGLLQHAGPDARTMACCGTSVFSTLTHTCCGVAALYATPNYNCTLVLG